MSLLSRAFIENRNYFFYGDTKRRLFKRLTAPTRYKKYPYNYKEYQNHRHRQKPAKHSFGDGKIAYLENLVRRYRKRIFSAAGYTGYKNRHFSIFYTRNNFYASERYGKKNLLERFSVFT
jgi:hypothetical protein